VILGVTGHQSIPNAARYYVASHLEELLRRQSKPLIGWSALAAGADQLFADLVLQAGGRLHVLIPARGYEETFSGSADEQHFRSLLTRATVVERLHHAEPSETAFLDAGRRIVERVEALVAVWDGEPARGTGGTADVVAYARDLGVGVHIVWPPGVER